MPMVTMWPLHEAPLSVLKNIFETKGLYVCTDHTHKPSLKTKIQMMLEQKTLKKLKHHLQINKSNKNH